MIPTDVVPIIITTTATPAPTSVTMVLPTPLTTSYEMLNTKTPNLSKETEEKRHDVDVDELPKAKTFSVKDVLPNVAKDESAALDKEKSPVMAITSPEPLTTLTTLPIEQKSKEEEEDVEVLPDFDEKGDVELEFHDESDVSTTSTTETTTSTISEVAKSPETPQASTTIPTVQDLLPAPSDISEKGKYRCSIDISINYD
ncbi:unnamed protein product [Cylicostephanus goldi]|uniref:Uncharacterized protein n=1 Tax=Cylicostephanus goldi TaxID=71465 RepID=A0A3P7PQJ8_CYLGO|nr:unnamed protein product [Cylicostephanus goldi]